jgi:hypothetical protein
MSLLLQHSAELGWWKPWCVRARVWLHPHVNPTNTHLTAAHTCGSTQTSNSCSRGKSSPRPVGVFATCGDDGFFTAACDAPTGSVFDFARLPAAGGGGTVCRMSCGSYGVDEAEDGCVCSACVCVSACQRPPRSCTRGWWSCTHTHLGCGTNTAGKKKEMEKTRHKHAHEGCTRAWRETHGHSAPLLPAAASIQ